MARGPLLTKPKQARILRALAAGRSPASISKAEGVCVQLVRKLRAAHVPNERPTRDQLLARIGSGKGVQLGDMASESLYHHTRYLLGTLRKLGAIVYTRKGGWTLAHPINPITTGAT